MMDFGLSWHFPLKPFSLSPVWGWYSDFTSAELNVATSLRLSVRGLKLHECSALVPFCCRPSARGQWWACPGLVCPRRRRHPGETVTAATAAPQDSSSCHRPRDKTTCKRWNNMIMTLKKTPSRPLKTTSCCCSGCQTNKMKVSFQTQKGSGSVFSPNSAAASISASYSRTLL